MKKKSIAARLGVVALALTLVTASLSSGTLAKFSYGQTYNAGFIVAKWNVNSQLSATTSGQSMAVNTTLNAYDLAQTATTTLANNTVVTSSSKPTVMAPGLSGAFYIDLTTAYKAGDSNAFTNDGDATEVAVDYWVYIVPTNGSSTPPSNFTMTAYKDTSTGADTKNPGLEWTALRSLSGMKNYGSSAYSENIIKTASQGDLEDYGYLLARGYINAGEASKNWKKIKIGWEWPYQSGTANNEEDQREQDEADTESGEEMTKVTYQIQVIMIQHDPTQALVDNPSLEDVVVPESTALPTPTPTPATGT